MVASKCRHGTTLLAILQVWILPCHGFTYPTYGLSSSSSAGAWSPSVTERQSSFAAALQSRPPKPTVTISRGTVPSLNVGMGGGEPFEPYADELPESEPDDDNNPFGKPGPYREEHTAGGSRYQELLARAKGQAPPPPTSAKPRRVVPPGGPPDYDDDGQWQEQAIGSPDVPDPPLRQEMPGLDLGPELNYGGGLPSDAGGGEVGMSGGSRFSRMMNQAKQNDDRQEAGMAPRASPRSPQEVAKRAAQAVAPVSKEEKDRAIRAAVERQQKMMAKARGIDLDDPTLDGAELARKKALSRAQAESQAGGYVPSSSAADDYLNSLKADSQRKQKETQARLQGKPLPPREEPLLSASPPLDPAAVAPIESQPLPSAEEYQTVKPQKRTAASWSIQNKADAYMASLKGIKVDISDNPYLKNQESLEELPPRQIYRPPPPPPAPPLGPKMSYAERLKLAKEAKAGGASAPDAPAAPAASAAVASPAVPPATPQTPPPQSLPVSSEPAKQAQDRNDVAAAEAVAAPTRPLEPEAPGAGLLGEDEARAKMMNIMDMLTEHKTAGLAGEERVSELRRCLTDTREYLRAETYGSSGGGEASSLTAPPPSPVPPPPPVQQQQQQIQQQQTQQQQPPTPPPQAAASASATPATPATPTTTPENAETLRRCSALLQAHVHSSLAGPDLQALVEGLTSSLAIVTAQVVAASAAVAGGVSGQGAPPANQEPIAASAAEVPAYVGGVQSIGGVLSDMEVDKKPASFMPEEGDKGEDDGGAGWTGGSLGDDEKAVASKALGYLLKHRGGKGYGRGRVKGAEAEAMVAALAEVTEIMQEEMVEE